MPPDQQPTQSGTANVTLVFEDGARVYPCHCGETHRGPYAVYDYGHHNCTHDLPLVVCEGLALCPQCGKDFELRNV